MILVDTSVWIDHLRRTEPELERALRQNRVRMHSMVLGELACGCMKDRSLRLRQLAALPRIAAVTDAEAMAFIEQYQLMNRGLGFVDIHLLSAAARFPGASLWTQDRSLARAARELCPAFNQIVD